MKYIFLHISKTAGTSFRKDVIEKNVKTYSFYQKELSNSLHTNNYTLNPKLSIKFKKDFNSDAFCAHMPYGLHQLLPGDDYNYITILRNPIDRVISHFNYDIDRGAYKGNDIFQWIKIRSNAQHEHRHISTIGSMHEKNVKIKYELALKNISDEKTIFGFTEKYDEFLSLINKEYGWVVKNTMKNVSKHKTNLTNTDITKIEDLCEYDIKFYNESIKIYNERFK
jgi:hypothetical protein